MVWVEMVYYCSVYFEIGQILLVCWLVGGFILLFVFEMFIEVFLWEEYCCVIKIVIVLLYGNCYEIDLVLVGWKVELVFDLFDLICIEVWLVGVLMRWVILYYIGCYLYLKVKFEIFIVLFKFSGIDYVQLIEIVYVVEFVCGVNYIVFIGVVDQIFGQFDLFIGQEV